MIFHPQNLKQTEGRYIFSGDLCATANSCLNKSIFREFWLNFTFQCSEIQISESEEYIFRIGKAEPLSLDGYDYSINVQKDGICVYAENAKNLISGFMCLIDRFNLLERSDALAIEVASCEIRDRAMIKNRMVHFCVFPETEIWELQRFVRLCASLRLTHIVLEFWGTLKLDAMAELSWSNGFSKDEIKPIIEEALALGLEIIPMFNHWGHAPQSRAMHGKHVVLDQNPGLQTYFSQDGWCWDIKKPKVKELLSEIRKELVGLCGAGDYFHIGCDEAYNFEFTKENIDYICDYINEISEEMLKLGRRVIVWGDMFLYQHEHYNPKCRYTCNAPTPEFEEYSLSRLSKNIVIADWQYRAMEAPVETSLVFKKYGFDTLICPWDEGRAQIDSVLETVKAESFMGFLHTTWHTLSGGMQYVLIMALGGYENVESFTTIGAYPQVASQIRKVMPAGGEYEKAGWSKFDINYKW